MQNGPPRKQSGTHAAVTQHVRAVMDEFRCHSVGPNGHRCTLKIEHDHGAAPTPHKDGDEVEWV